MTNAEKFKMYFGLYATEVWAKSETEFLKWLNADAQFDSCDDAVSRQDIFTEIEEILYEVDACQKPEKWYNLICRAVKNLPSVTPKQNDLDLFGNPLKVRINIKGITCDILAKDLRKAINNVVEKAEPTEITAFVVSKELCDMDELKPF